MKLAEFLTLPPSHNVEFGEGQKLLKDIAQNDLPSLSEEQMHLVKDYLTVNLLHKCVPLDLVPELEAKLGQLEQPN